MGLDFISSVFFNLFFNPAVISRHYEAHPIKLFFGSAKVVKKHIMAQRHKSILFGTCAALRYDPCCECTKSVVLMEC